MLSLDTSIKLEEATAQAVLYILKSGVPDGKA